MKLSAHHCLLIAKKTKGLKASDTNLNFKGDINGGTTTACDFQHHGCSTQWPSRLCPSQERRSASRFEVAQLLIASFSIDSVQQI
jgi:hypothetical protein